MQTVQIIWFLIFGNALYDFVAPIYRVSQRILQLDIYKINSYVAILTIDMSYRLYNAYSIDFLNYLDAMHATHMSPEETKLLKNIS